MANFNTRLKRMTKQADRTKNEKTNTVTINSDDYYWFRHQLIMSKKDNLLELNEMYVQENKRLKVELGESNEIFKCKNIPTTCSRSSAYN